MNALRHPGRPLLLAAALLAALAGCTRYEPLPWLSASGAGSVEVLTRRLASLLEEGVRKSERDLRRLRTESGYSELYPVKVVVAGFPEARSGVRTELSRRIEEGIRRALAGSKTIEVVDGGMGVKWQLSYSTKPLIKKPKRSKPPGPGMKKGGVLPPGLDVEAPTAVGIPTADVERLADKGLGIEGIRSALAKELDDDSPLRGLWPDVQKRSEGSAVYAASMVEADAAIYGAYALGPKRIRVWASVVVNAPVRTLYYQRTLRDVFGEAERLTRSRLHLAFARGYLPVADVPPAWLSERDKPSVPRRPWPPLGWVDPGFEVRMERLRTDATRAVLHGGEVLGPKSLVVGRLGAKQPHYVYAFSIDATGRTAPVFTALEDRRRAGLVRPGHWAFFTARLLPPGHAYRIYFVSSPSPFEGVPFEAAARARLGLAGKGKNVPRPWFVPPGADRLPLEPGWGQRVFWFYKNGSE